MENSWFDKTFRDNQGNIVIAQKPNPPLVVGVVAAFVTLLLPERGNFYLAMDVIAFGALFTWGWLELFQGVNYFRRTLGLVALLVLIASRLQW